MAEGYINQSDNAKGESFYSGEEITNKKGRGWNGPVMDEFVKQEN
jgi:hypothetical protein